MGRSVGPAALGRRRGTRAERARILIITEGKVTEPQYFRGLAQHVRATGVDIRSADIIGLGRDPRRIVSEAVRLLRRSRRAGRSGDDYDAAWCVVDVDNHALLPEALAEARREGVSVVVTNPCFELWILMHFSDCMAVVDAGALRRRLEQHGCAEKKLPRDFDFSQYKSAIERAVSQRKARGEAASLDMPSNPGTTVDLLVAELLS
ncbi:RloB family protein [Micromonospora marina]|uniref:RloB family protein n=1 Tax=Micromonospora marina TaxID=307120 RepID=UPI003D72C0B4